MHLLIISSQSSTFQHATALATACHAAAVGQRVLLIGAGPSGLLGQLLGQPLDSTPREVSPNLRAMELVAVEELSRGWEALRTGSTIPVPSRLREIEKDELPGFPGMDEIAALVVAARAAREEALDLIVLGGPTTDCLLRSITLRDTARWLLRLIGGLDRGPGKSLSSQEKALLPLSLLAPNAASMLQELRVLLERYGGWLDASTGTRIRLVMPAEEVSVPVMRHVMGGMGLYGLEVDAVFVHGDEADVDPVVHQKLGPTMTPFLIPVTPASLEEWAHRGAYLYEKRAAGLGLPEPSERSTFPPLAVEQRQVRLHIPFLEAKSLDIGISSEEVIVRMGQFRRHLLVAEIGQGGRLRAAVEGETLRLWVEAEPGT
ncbi:MAG: ATPase [Chloroflexaceae bacterium]|nr:ATPase [Chloroflexaceae bacterium]